MHMSWERRDSASLLEIFKELEIRWGWVEAQSLPKGLFKLDGERAKPNSEKVRTDVAKSSANYLSRLKKVCVDEANASLLEWSRP